MRATLRLITGWVSVTIAIVALGWTGLRAAVTAATNGDTGGFSTLDPSALDHRPGTSLSGPDVGGAGVAAPRPAPEPRKAPATDLGQHRMVPPPLSAPPPSSPNSTDGSQAPPPPVVPSRSPPAPVSSPVTQKPDQAATTVNTQGGSVALTAANGAIEVQSIAPAEGYSSRQLRGYDGSLVFEFQSATHVSQISAYVDAAGMIQVTTGEKDLDPATG